jgi:hypothetical protein
MRQHSWVQQGREGYEQCTCCGLQRRRRKSEPNKSAGKRRRVTEYRLYRTETWFRVTAQQRAPSCRMDRVGAVAREMEEHDAITFGTMRVIDRDQHRGRRYCCGCGWEGWSVWGHARLHAAQCPQSYTEKGR